jgi:predicted ATPase
MYINNFRLRNWKNFKEAESSLEQRVFLIGPNASGKSNYLDALHVAVPLLEDLTVQMDQQGTPHLMGRYEHWRAQGTFQYETQFSNGTLRLFGLLWTMFEGTGPLLLEEPELSLHAEVVRHLAEMFERIQKAKKTRRQTFINTHSDEMLRNKSIGAEEVLWLYPSLHGTIIKKRILKTENCWQVV